MKSACLTILILALLAGGCATGPKINIDGIDWKSRIGTYTYEQALAELGPPSVEGQSGDGMNAQWVISQSPATSFSIGLGTATYGGSSSTGVGVGTTMSPPPGGEYLNLRFDKNGKLTEWTRIKH